MMKRSEMVNVNQNEPEKWKKNLITIVECVRMFCSYWIWILEFQNVFVMHAGNRNSISMNNNKLDCSNNRTHLKRVSEKIDRIQFFCCPTKMMIIDRIDFFLNFHV